MELDPNRREPDLIWDDDDEDDLIMYDDDLVDENDYSYGDYDDGEDFV
tara:strand:+ start:1014 stop:1157 length:144 start_codon:yes stop_codon:yes gene_type:complete